MRAIAAIESRNQGPRPQDSKDLPSPPSSMINTTTEEVTQEGKTEVTMVDSLYLELASGPIQLDEQPLSAEDKEKIPYDLSISSENEVTNGDQDKSDHEHGNSEGSLHDSMEILEEVATEDHFDNDLPADDSESDDAEPKDIFEMPPMPDTVNAGGAQGETPPPPPGGQEFIF